MNDQFNCFGVGKDFTGLEYFMPLRVVVRTANYLEETVNSSYLLSNDNILCSRGWHHINLSYLLSKGNESKF